MEKKPLIYWIIGGVLVGLVISLVTSSSFQPTTTKANEIEINIDAIPLSGKITEPLTLSSSVSDVLALMTQSSGKWGTLHVSYAARFRDHGDSKLSQEYQHEFWLTSEGQGRLEIRSFDGIPELVWVNDKTDTWTADITAGTYTQMKLPQSIQAIESSQSLSESQTSQDLALSNASALLIPSGLNDYLYPKSLAQSMNRTTISDNASQYVSIIGSDSIAGRETIMLERKIVSLDEQPVMYKLHRYWIDAETGIVLKGEVEDLTNGGWIQQFEATALEIDTDIPQEKFVFVPDPDFKLFEP
ncbi:MAG: sigma-E factor regulatory protein RseB domain-containing protein [Anaerolineaceae bacterium]